MQSHSDKAHKNYLYTQSQRCSLLSLRRFTGLGCVFNDPFELFFCIKYEFWLKVRFLIYWCPIVPVTFVKYSPFSFKLHLQWSQTSVYHMSFGLFLDASDFCLFSRSVVSNCLRPHGLQHTRPPCPSPTAELYPNPCRWVG